MPPKKKGRVSKPNRRRGRRAKRMTPKAVEQIVREQAVSTITRKVFVPTLPPADPIPISTLRLRTFLKVGSTAIPLSFSATLKLSDFLTSGWLFVGQTISNRNYYTGTFSRFNLLSAKVYGPSTDVQSALTYRVTFYGIGRTPKPLLVREMEI